MWICKCVPAFYVNYSIQPDIIRDEILPLIDQIGQEKNVPVIDLYTALADGSLFPDGIHPNVAGAGVMAQTIAPYLLGVRFSLDFDHDGIVNFTDFARLALLWRQSDPSLDVAPVPSGDGVINWLDLGGLARFWVTYPGLVGYWKLDESEGTVAHDSLGHIDGVVHGVPLWQSAGGEVGGALELDGLDDYISTSNILDPGAGAFTVLLWVRGGRPGQTILSQSDKTGTGEVWLGTDTATGALIDAADGRGPRHNAACFQCRCHGRRLARPAARLGRLGAASLRRWQRSRRRHTQAQRFEVIHRRFLFRSRKRPRTGQLLVGSARRYPRL